MKMEIRGTKKDEPEKKKCGGRKKVKKTGVKKHIWSWTIFQLISRWKKRNLKKVAKKSTEGETRRMFKEIPNWQEGKGCQVKKTPKSQIAACSTGPTPLRKIEMGGPGGGDR